MSTTVTYKGDAIATVSNQTKTLKTQGKYMEDDVSITDVTPILQAKSNIDPTTSSQTITPDTGYDGLSSVQINAMPNGSATTPATTITAPPTLSVANATGIVTASISKTQGVTPSVSAGYVSSGTEGTITVSGSNTLQLNTQAATQITPSTQVQTAVPSGRFTTGAVTVAAMPSGSATAPSNISGSGATLTTSDPNTLTLSKTVSVTPNVSAGYIANGTAGNSDVSLSAFVQLLGATTYTPTTTNQTIASDKYLTGTQTILGDENLVAWNIKEGVTIFGVTGTYSGGGSDVNTIKGKAPLTFNAVASAVSALTQYGLVENIGTPSPTSPAPIKCNKGTMSVSGDVVSFTGSTGSITLGGNTLTTATLLGIGDKQDTHNILTGAVTHYIKYKILTGSESFTSSPIATGVPALRLNTGATWRVDASYAPVCSHFVGRATKTEAALVENSCCWQSASYAFFRTNDSATDFKTWLANQYNNGTPVVIFYASTQTTTESLSAQSASTVAGSNTLTIDADVYGATEITYNIS